MTLDRRLQAAVNDTRDRIRGLTGQPIGRKRRWVGTTARAVAVLGLIGMMVVVWMSVARISNESIPTAGTIVEASLQPTAGLGELNRATELVTIDGRSLSSLDVRSLVVDDTGTVWLAVAEPWEEGQVQTARLYSFDGRDWRELEVPEPGYWGALAGNDEALWVHTFQGIARFDGTSWKHFTTDDGVPISNISSAEIGPDGELWLYSSGLLVGSSITDDPLGEEPPSWMERSRVTVFDGTVWRHWDAVAEQSMQQGFLDLGPDGTPWIASTGARWGEEGSRGVLKLDNEKWVQVWEGTKSLAYFSSLAIDGRGDLWAAYREFVLHLTEDGAELLDSTDGVGSKPGEGAAINWRPTDIEVDGDVVWIATMGGGISRFDGTTWQTFDEDDGLPSPEVAEIEVGADGLLWLRVGGLDGQRVIVFDP